MNVSIPGNYTVSEILQYVSFCNWLILLGKTSSNFLHNEVCVRISFLAKLMFPCMHTSHFVGPFTVGNLSCCHLSAVVNDVNMGERILFKQFIFTIADNSQAATHISAKDIKVKKKKNTDF